MPEQPCSISNASIGHHGRRRGRGHGRIEEEEERKKKEEREDGRRDRREEGRTQDRRRKPVGGEDSDWCLYTAEKKRCRCH